MRRTPCATAMAIGAGIRGRDTNILSALGGSGLRSIQSRTMEGASQSGALWLLSVLRRWRRLLLHQRPQPEVHLLGGARLLDGGVGLGQQVVLQRGVDLLEAAADRVAEDLG